MHIMMAYVKTLNSTRFVIDILRLQKMEMGSSCAVMNTACLSKTEANQNNHGRHRSKIGVHNLIRHLGNVARFNVQIRARIKTLRTTSEKPQMARSQRLKCGIQRARWRH